MKKIVFFYFVCCNVFALVPFETLREQIRQDLIRPHHPINDWDFSKKIILQKIHLRTDEHGYFVRDVYCHKIIRDGISPQTMPDNKVINIEHTWPQSKFTQKKSIVQKSDLHHLFPSDNYANNKRANLPFTRVIEDTGHRVKDCFLSKIGYIRPARTYGFEPPQEHKGNVARALFYFAVRYDAEIPDYEEVILRQWHLMDPADDEERQRNDLIESIQGNRNLFIDDPSLVNQVIDF